MVAIRFQINNEIFVVISFADFFLEDYFKVIFHDMRAEL